MNLPDDNHVLINQYGCSVTRRQVQEKTYLKHELLLFFLLFSFIRAKKFFICRALMSVFVFK
jgi:hypothetical protein